MGIFGQFFFGAPWCVAPHRQFCLDFKAPNVAASRHCFFTRPFWHVFFFRMPNLQVEQVAKQNDEAMFWWPKMKGCLNNIYIYICIELYVLYVVRRSGMSMRNNQIPIMTCWLTLTTSRASRSFGVPNQPRKPSWEKNGCSVWEMHPPVSTCSEDKTFSQMFKALNMYHTFTP